MADCKADIIESAKYYSAMISKENGEIVKSLYIDEDDHWKEELGDLCCLGIKPMLDKAELSYEQACEIGEKRYDEKIRVLYIIDKIKEYKTMNQNLENIE